MNTFSVSNYDDFKEKISKGGFIKCGWDGTEKTEEMIKKDTKATIRCIPFNEDISEIQCIFTGKPAKQVVIFSKAY